MTALEKNWNDHVVHAEEVARTRGFADLRDRIVELAEPSATDVVVDIGSGTGLLALAIAPRVERVWAVDIAAAMTEYLGAKAASAGLGNVVTVTASAVSLPLVDASADLVISNYCFPGCCLTLPKVWSMLRLGMPGVVRLVKNGVRYAGRRWERPARADWWEAALIRAGFTHVDIQVLAHEGGLATARRR